MSARIGALLAMLERGQDSALLRFSLGSEFLGEDQHSLAAEHLQQAVKLDPNYSAAWKLLGKTLAIRECTAEAIDAYQKGIEVAEANGDRQAAREMAVFLRRLQKESDS
jgi:Tfp pilus assembly protein PilF